MATCAGCSTAILARCEATLREGKGMSFDFAGDGRRVARHEFVLATIHDQIEVFHYDCTQQRVTPIRFHDGVEHAAAALALDAGILDHVKLLAGAPGAHLPQREAERIDNAFGKHRMHRFRVYDSLDGYSPDLVGRQKSEPGEYHIAVIR